MMKKLVIIGIVTILFTVELSGCTSSTADIEKFVGTWYNDDGTVMTFFSNGTFVSDIDFGTWELKNGNFFINSQYYNKSQEWNYVFSNNDTSLTLKSTTNDFQFILTKQ